MALEMTVAHLKSVLILDAEGFDVRPVDEIDRVAYVVDGVIKYTDPGIAVGHDHEKVVTHGFELELELEHLSV